MTRTKPLLAIAAAAMLVLAGCSGGIGGGAGTATTAGPADDGTNGGTDDGTDGGTDSGESGSIDFYLSDKPIEDFEHLNVTITKIGVKRAGDAADDGENDESEDDGETTTTAATGNGTTTTTATTAATTTTDTETESDGDDEADDGDGEWVTYEVNRTVDLTELQGANATKLANFAVPSGTYTTVFIYVSDIDATLETGEQVNVKLPSNKLQIHKSFEVSKNSSVDFVFDVSVFKAGKSGKYILKPVISQSGTGDEVEIDPVDDDEDEGDEGKDNDRNGDESDDETMALSATFRGKVTAGEAATLKVTSDGEPVANATVYLNGERVGTTGADGTIEISIPEGAEEIEIEVVKGDAEYEFEVAVGGGSGKGSGDRSITAVAP